MASAILASLFHPSEVLALVQYKLAPKTKYDYSNDKNRQRLYHHLNMTSRSFAAVIQDLDEELKDAVSSSLSLFSSPICISCLLTNPNPRRTQPWFSATSAGNWGIAALLLGVTNLELIHSHSPVSTFVSLLLCLRRFAFSTLSCVAWILSVRRHTLHMQRFVHRMMFPLNIDRLYTSTYAALFLSHALFIYRGWYDPWSRHQASIPEDFPRDYLQKGLELYKECVFAFPERNRSLYFSYLATKGIVVMRRYLCTNLHTLAFRPCSA